MWDGSAWGAANELSTNTGEANLLRPFTFLFDAVQNYAPTDIVFDSESAAEQTVNTYGTSDQIDPAIAAFSDGGYVVVWVSNGQDGDDYGIYGKRFNADGTANGSEFLVASESTDAETNPSVATFSDGGFVVSWQDQTSGVMAWTDARVFNADGTPATADFRVSPGMDGNNEGYQPAVVALNEVEFVVVWANESGGATYEIAGQIYNRAGATVGSQFSVGSLLGGGALFGAQAEVTRLDDGGFAVAWRTNNGSLGTRARVMNSNGSARSAELILPGDNIADISSLSNGGFIVTYDSGGDLKGAICDSNGVIHVAEFTVNTTSSAARYESTVTRSDDGFVVVWESDNGDGSASTILAQRFDINGIAIDGEVVVNQTTAGNQQKPEVVETASGQVIAVWQSENVDAALTGIASRVLATGDASVVENSANGTRVADVQGVLDLDIGDSHTFTLFDDAGGRFAIDSSTGVITVANGLLLDYEVATSHNITVRATDSMSKRFDEVLTIQVTGVNDNTPAITSNGGGATAAVNVTENSTAVTTVTATDADLPSETLTYSISGGADSAKFAINSSSGVLTFVAGPDYETPTDVGANNVYDVTVQVSDGTFTDTQAIAVTVTPVTDNTPVITSDGGGATAAINVAENSTAVTTVAATDADLPSETLTYSISGGADAAKFAINSSSGVLTFVAGPDYESPTDAGTNNVYDVTVQVSDGTLTDTQAIAVTVTPVTDNTPVITSDGGGATAAVNVAENTTVVTTVTATDADLPSETLTYSISGGVDAAKFAINSSSGALTFVAAPDYETPTDTGTNNVYDVTVQVSDGTLTDTQAIAVTVTPVTDNTPVITSDGGGATAAVNVAENSTAVTTVTATDADLPSETLTYSISGGVDAAKFAINSSSGVLTFVAAPDYEAPTDTGTNNVYDVIVQVSDGTLTDTQALVVTVMSVNDNSPVFQSMTGPVVPENLVTVMTVHATDADSPAQSVTYSISGGADQARFMVNGATGVLTFLAAPDFESPTDANLDNVYDLEVTADDGNGGTSVQSIGVTVTDINESPIASGDAYSLDEDGVLSITPTLGVLANDIDPESAPLAATLVAGPANGSLVLNSDGSFTYTPNANYNGPDMFSYRANDGVNSSNVVQVSINVNSMNDNPVGNSESYTVNNDGTLIVGAAGLLANDSDIEGDALSAVLVSGPASGTLNLASDGSFVYTPTLSFSGIVTFAYQADDGVGVSNLVTVTIEVIATAGQETPTSPPDHEPPAERDAPPDAEPPGTSESPEDGNESPVAPLPISPESKETIEANAAAQQAAEPAAVETSETTNIGPLDQGDDETVERARNRNRARLDADEIARIDLVQGTYTANPFFDTRVFWERLNEFDQEVNEGTSSMLQMTAGSAASVTLAFTAGYVLWTVKGGYLMASFLSSLPAWQSMDPLPILEVGTSDWTPKKPKPGDLRPDDLTPDDQTPDDDVLFDAR